MEGWDLPTDAPQAGFPGVSPARHISYNFPATVPAVANPLARWVQRQNGGFEVPA